jgi:tRNA (mo5U34)-methyltransferase
MSSVAARVRELDPWFHNLHLPDGTQTSPSHPLGDFPLRKWLKIAPHIPADLDGWNVLDVGCNAGFYSIELAKRGARVTGIDLNRHYLAQADWAVAQFGLTDRIELLEMQVYDLARLERTWDLVWFMGVFYHLRYPMLGLDIVSQKAKRMMVFQTLTMPGMEVYEKTAGLGILDRSAMLEPGWPKMAFIEHDLANDRTNWWAANHSCVEAMLRSAGMRILHEPGEEIYICEPDPQKPSCITTWDRAEFDAAVGRSPAPRPYVP